MKNDPWIKLILFSLGSLIISLSLLLTIQQFNTFHYNRYDMMSGLNGQGMQQQIDNNQHNH